MKTTFTLFISLLTISSVSAQSIRQSLAQHTIEKPRHTHCVPTSVPSQEAPIPCHTPYIQVMSPYAFEMAKRQINECSFDSRKVELAKYISSQNFMTALQIREIALLFTFDSYRYEFAKSAYDTCINPGEYFILTNTFTFNSYAQALMEATGMPRW